MSLYKFLRTAFLDALQFMQAAALFLIDRAVLALQSVFPILVLAPHERTIGNTSEEIFFGMLLARLEGRKLLLVRRWSLFGAPVICNKEIFRLEGEHIAGGWGARALAFVLSAILSLGFGWIPAAVQFLALNLPFLILYPLKCFAAVGRLRRPPQFWLRSRFGHCFFDLSLGVDRIWKELSAHPDFQMAKEIHNPPKLDLRKAAREDCERRLLALGISPRDWFVCVHVRDSGFWKDGEDFRNSTVENYLPAMREVVRRGGKVVRLGDSSAKKLPEIAGVIDYAHSALRNEAMDLYLIKNCRLFIGQNSGVFDTTKLFAKKVVAVNVTEWAFGAPIFFGDLAVLKHFYHVTQKRYLSVQELLQFPFQKLYFSPTTKQPDLEITENTAEEILAVLRESLDQDENYGHSDLQKAFIRGRERQAEAWMREPVLLPGLRKRDVMVARISSRARGVAASLGKDFLEKNWAVGGKSEPDGARQ